MLRALALAIGVTLAILGLECIVVQKFIMAAEPRESSAFAASYGNDAFSSRREYEPPEWMPWSLMSAGAVVILYSFTIPRRVAG